MANKTYSWDLNDWVMGQIPSHTRQALFQEGWNVFGIYELVKEGIALEKKGILTPKLTRQRKLKGSKSNEK
ncbi:hypothetical protein LCGC14_2022170 [marine sediment metagenome]|uniref:Uncharacterized protein n=1 Tax=marine sediment metagenome TaxID=412755 RepID=A0A0F9HU94_9ZZZZ